MKNKTDLQALKALHKIEMVMIETGEKFETGPEQWRCLTVPGLVVNIPHQTYQFEQPGQPAQTGDVFAWLRWRYGWSFGMALRYLVNRAPDPLQNTPAIEEKPRARVGFIQPEAAQAPQDKWQRKAFALAGADVVHLFSLESWEIMGYLQAWPSRFLPVVDLCTEECQECGAAFDWSKPETLCYLTQFYDYAGEPMPEKEQRLFILDNENLTGFICEKCKREKVAYFIAIQHCYRSARAREIRGPA